MKTFYYARPIAKGFAALMICACGVAAIVAPRLDSGEALRMAELLNSKSK